MSAYSVLVLNLGLLPRGVMPARDALASTSVECQQSGGRVPGLMCLSCPRLVFWMVAPERDRLKLFCRRSQVEP